MRIEMVHAGEIELHLFDGNADHVQTITISGDTETIEKLIPLIYECYVGIERR
jgi:hypothetical protein